jgi:hypothetical protein
MIILKSEPPYYAFTLEKLAFWMVFFLLCLGGLFQTSQRVLMYVQKTLKVQEAQKIFYFKPINHYRV